VKRPPIYITYYPNSAIWCFIIELSSDGPCRNTVTVISTLIMIHIEYVTEDYNYMGNTCNTV